ncbi:MAG: PH domain-containing protein [Myxococcales bacterium]|nr:PH domain-containing protein [Myxococcales bacterium]
MAAATGGQRLLRCMVPPGWFAALEAGTRRHALECPCGHVRDLWEAGGVQFSGNKKQTLARCPSCRALTWHLKRRKSFSERRQGMEAQRLRGEDRVFIGSKVWWFSVLSWGSAAAVWTIPVFTPHLAHAPARYAALWLGTFVLGWLVGPWFWFTTRYHITDKHLILHSGPLRATLELARIAEVSKTRKGIGVSFATDTNCLWIAHPVFGTSGALVAPEDRTLFVAALDEACEYLHERDGELVHQDQM